MGANRHHVMDGQQPLRRSEALRSGITLAELLGPHYQRVFHDVYVASGVRLTPIERGRAALHVAPTGTHVSHHTAAQIWAGVARSDSRIHVSVPNGQPRSVRRGIAAHRATAEPDIRTQRGVPISSPAQCFCEIAADGARLADLVVLGDSMVGSGSTTPHELIAAADRWPGRQQPKTGRAARLVRDGVDSPMESRLRMLIVLAGLPEPDINVIVRHPNGDWKLRFDLCYPALQLVIEYDGDQHLDSKHRALDLERREELERLGWRIIVVQKQHFYAQPETVLDRVRQARLDRGASAASCRIRRAWVNHFGA